MDPEDDNDMETGWGSVNRGIGSLARQTQQNHAEVMTLLRSLLSDPWSNDDLNKPRLGWTGSRKETSLRNIDASLETKVSALERKIIDRDAKLSTYENIIDKLVESCSKKKSELAKSEETIQSLQEMIRGHQEAKMESEEEISRLSFSNKGLIRQLENLSDSPAASSWFSFLT